MKIFVIGVTAHFLVWAFAAGYTYSFFTKDTIIESLNLYRDGLTECQKQLQYGIPGLEKKGAKRTKKK